LILSILIATILYVLLATSVVRLAGGTELSRSEAPIAYAASTVLEEPNRSGRGLLLHHSSRPSSLSSRGKPDLLARQLREGRF
jgi:hypothetical protein